MIHIYKAGGDWSTVDGKEYTVKSINPQDKSKHLIDGWVLNLGLIEDIEDAVFEEVKPSAKKKTKKGS